MRLLLEAAHIEALRWFQDHAGAEITWPGKLGHLFLANKAKGIHKPKGWSHALSVRHSLTGEYPDRVRLSDGSNWEIEYAQEGSDPELFTNRALQACAADEVPVGVIVQVAIKPRSKYLVLGIGRVSTLSPGRFRIVQWGNRL